MSYFLISSSKSRHTDACERDRGYFVLIFVPIYREVSLFNPLCCLIIIPPKSRAAQARPMRRHDGHRPIRDSGQTGARTRRRRRRPSRHAVRRDNGRRWRLYETRVWHASRPLRADDGHRPLRDRSYASDLYRVHSILIRYTLYDFLPLFARKHGIICFPLSTVRLCFARVAAISAGVSATRKPATSATDSPCADCNLGKKRALISFCAFFNYLLGMIELSKIYRRGDTHGVYIMAGGD